MAELYRDGNVLPFDQGLEMALLRRIENSRGADNAFMKNVLLASVLLFAAAFVGAAQQPGRDDLREAVGAFVHAQTQTLPGDVTIKVDEIDRRIKLTPCPAREIFLPPGARLLGNASVGVRCPGGAGEKGWTIFVPVHVTVSVTMLVASKPLPQGHIMAAQDFSMQRGELNQTGIVTEAAQVIGKILAHGVGAGQVLRQEMLRAPYAVRQGQLVQLLLSGPGFKVGNQGLALNDAAAGQTLQVRMPSGTVLSGTAREEGVVQIRR